ncbi:MAG: STAS domain-containing protein [Candidatus Baltobacteraceae bacterium]
MDPAGSSIASFSGEIDFTGKDAFDERLRALDVAETAIVDLTDVTYMDSTALSQLIRLLRRRLDAGKTAPRVVTGSRVARLFRVAGLGEMIPAFETLGEAQTV